MYFSDVFGVLSLSSKITLDVVVDHGKLLADSDSQAIQPQRDSPAKRLARLRKVEETAHWHRSCTVQVGVKEKKKSQRRERERERAAERIDEIIYARSCSRSR